MVYDKGDIYDGSWKCNKWHGEGTLTSKTGSRFKGHFELGLKSGEGTMFFSDGSRFDGKWSNDT